MDVTYTHCAGLDVHKKTVVACCITPGARGEKQHEVRTFSTMTVDLLALSDWLSGLGVTHVAMESTGEFWKPVYNILEGNFEFLVVNAKHIKNVPGRKTDVKDAEWIADLLRHGLLRGSFIPPQAQRDLRDLTRQRTNLVQDRTAVVNRLQKVCEWSNIKLSAVATDITGVSARAMLEAILAGHSDPQTLADLAKGRLRNKRSELERALTGVVRDHHALHSRPADLVDGGRGHGVGDAGQKRGLAGGGLSDACRKYAAHQDLVDVARLETAALQSDGNRARAEVRRAQAGQCALESADRGARRAGDHYGVLVGSHGDPPRSMSAGGSLAAARGGIQAIQWAVRLHVVSK